MDLVPTDAEVAKAERIYNTAYDADFGRGYGMRRALESFLQGRAPAGLSWSGFNLYGDAKSIAKAKSMLHGSDTVVPALRDAITELQGRAKLAQEEITDAHHALLEAAEAVLSNEEHAVSCGARSYQKESPTWQVYKDLGAAIRASKGEKT